MAFATNGALPATLLARYAEVKDLLGLDEAAFGVVVVGFSLGAALTVNLPGVVVRRLGTRRSTGLGTVIVALALALAGLGAAQGSVWLFVVGLAVAGLCDPVVDVAQNGQGLRVQTVYGRSVLNSMHAGWSVGAATGGLVGVLAASTGVPLPVHLLIWGAVCVLAMVLAGRQFLPDPPLDDGRAGGEPEPEAAQRPVRRRALPLLVPVIVLALVGVSVEDLGNNWSAVLLATEQGVPIEAAGIGLTTLLVAQFVGRLVGDRVIDRLGQRRAVTGSLTALAAGLLLAAWSPWAAGSLAGLALAGLGSAVTVPIAFARADAVPGLRAHTGVTWVSWAMRAATVGLSPLVGVVSGATSLPVAFTGVAGVALIALIVVSTGRGTARQRPTGRGGSAGQD